MCALCLEENLNASIFFLTQDIQQLGEVTHLSQVKLHTQTGEKYERIFVLFSNSLVMLSMSPRLSSYQYEVSAVLCSIPLVISMRSVQFPDPPVISMR